MRHPFEFGRGITFQLSGAELEQALSALAMVAAAEIRASGPRLRPDHGYPRHREARARQLWPRSSLRVQK
eukprot:3998199-Pleurochrysis_carterae.AAC.1